MPTILDVDGKVFKDPNGIDIADSFHSMDKRTGFLHEGISVVTLYKAGRGAITAWGHPVHGFSLSCREGDIAAENYSDDTLTLDETIVVFQRYARGEDWGRDTHAWHQVETLDSRTQAKRLLWIALVGLMLFGVYLVIEKWFLDY